LVKVIKISFFIIGLAFIFYNITPLIISKFVFSIDSGSKKHLSKDLRTGEVLPHGKSIIRYSDNNQITMLFFHDALEPDYPGYYSSWFDALYEKGINIIAPVHGPYIHLDALKSKGYPLRNPYEWTEGLCRLINNQTVIAATGSGVFPAIAAAEHLGDKVSSLVLISPLMENTVFADDSNIIQFLLQHSKVSKHFMPYLPRHQFQVKELTPFNISDSLSELEFWTQKAKSNTPGYWDLDYLDFLKDSSAVLDPHYWLDINASFDITIFYSQLDRYTSPEDYETWGDSLKKINENVIVRAMEGSGFTQLQDKHKLMIKNLIEEKLSASR